MIMVMIMQLINGEIRRERFFFNLTRLDKLKIRRLKQAIFPGFLFHLRFSCLTGILLGSRKRFMISVYTLGDSGRFARRYYLPDFRFYVKLSLFISSIRLKES